MVSAQGDPFAQAVLLREMLASIRADLSEAERAHGAWRAETPGSAREFAGKACMLALARLFDRPRYDARGRSDRASLPHALHLLADRATLIVLIDQAPGWTPDYPELSEENREMAAIAGLRALAVYRRRAAADTAERSAIRRVMRFRDRHLAHSLIGGSEKDMEPILWQDAPVVLALAARLTDLLLECCTGEGID